MARPAKPKTELAQRLIDIRGDRTRDDFALELGMSVRTYGNYERGDHEPDFRFMQELVRKERLSPHWLLLGEGPMRREAASDPVGSQSETMLSEREANALLDAVEQKLEQLEEIPAKQPYSADLAEIYSDLKRVATAPGLPDEIKARADVPLRIVFEDLAANSRQKIREVAWESRMKLAKETVERALQGAEYKPSNSIRQLLLTLVVANKVNESTLSWIIAELKSAKSSTR